MSMSDTESSGEKEVRIRRGKVDSLSLYEITDYELDTLAKGSPGSIYLNFGIFLISSAVSFLVALLTTTFKSDRLFAVFTLIVIGGFVGGALLLALWWRSKGEVTDVIARIKNRIPS